MTFATGPPFTGVPVWFAVCALSFSTWLLIGGVHARCVLKPVRTPVAFLGSLGVCIYVPASRHWLISHSPIHLT